MSSCSSAPGRHRRASPTRTTHIAGYILESGRAVVVAVNKWDAVDDLPGTEHASSVSIVQRLPFLKFAPVLQISPRSAAGLRSGLEGDRRCPRLGRTARCRRRCSPGCRSRRCSTRARSAPAPSARSCATPTRAGMNPPVVVVHGNSLEHVTERLASATWRAASAPTSSSPERRCGIEMINNLTRHHRRRFHHRGAA